MNVTYCFVPKYSIWTFEAFKKIEYLHYDVPSSCIATSDPWGVITYPLGRKYFYPFTELEASLHRNFRVEFLSKFPDEDVRSSICIFLER